MNEQTKIDENTFNAMENNCFLLTIGIPTWNRKKYLEPLLDAIIDQIQKDNLNNIQVLVSDNDSDDGTFELIQKKYMSRYNFFYYNRNKKNLKGIGNIKKLIEISKGEYLWFIGDDDLVMPSSIKKVYSVIQNIGKKQIILLNCRTQSNPKPIYEKPVKEENISIEEDKFATIFNDRWGFLLSTLILPTSEAKKIIQSYDLNLYWPHVHIFILIAKMYGVSFKIIPQPLIIQSSSDANLIYCDLDAFIVLYYYKLLILESVERQLSSDMTYVKNKFIISYPRLRILFGQYILDAYIPEKTINVFMEGFKNVNNFRFRLSLIPFFIPKILRRIIVYMYLKLNLPKANDIRTFILQNNKKRELVINSKNKGYRRVIHHND